jgi:hypothetical protein
MGQRFFASIQKELGDGEFCRAVVPTCTGSAAPWCRHAHICCHRGNGDAFDCRALCDAALHDGL